MGGDAGLERGQPPVVAEDVEVAVGQGGGAFFDGSADPLSLLGRREAHAGVEEVGGSLVATRSAEDEVDGGQELFLRGLCRVVFATETLALGINMPARSVVIESLSKFTGEHHEFLTPGEYTQLTGRAGRRGIDEVGRAVVPWSPFVTFDQVAALASSRQFALTSSFRATYNMTANLVRRYDAEEAHRLLNRSFAQFQADRSVVKLEARRELRAAALAELELQAACDRGDVEEYCALARADDDSRRAASPRATIETALSRLRPGDVIDHRGSRLAVLTVAHRGAGKLRMHAVGPKGRSVSLDASDFDEAPERLASVALPKPYAPNNRAFKHEVVRQLLQIRVKGGGGRSRRRTELVSRADAHPVASCPDRKVHLGAAIQAERLRREVGDLSRRIGGSAESVARRFDAVLGLLGSWGYVDGWRLTPKGNLLVRTYHEADLLVAEALHRGLLDDLDPAGMAGMVSCLTYEHRSRIPPGPPWFPDKGVRQRFVELEAVGLRLQADERRAHLPESRLPDPTFFALAYAWASGEDLDAVLADEDLSGGDFVRNIRQLIDLLRQVGESAPVPLTQISARAAADRLFRGVVAASAILGRAPAGEEGSTVVAPEP